MFGSFICTETHIKALYRDKIDAKIFKYQDSFLGFIV